MLELDAHYPEYGFAKHKGYGTKQHIDAIRQYGLCEIHRRTFTRKFVRNP
jgi:ribonuclease HII